MFQCPESGSYLFLVTVATYEGRPCQLSLKRNGRTEAGLVDTREAGARGMLSQHCLLELETSDKIQVAVEAGCGIADTSALHLTQFTGLLLRPGQESFKTILKSLADEELSLGEGFRGLTPSRGTTPLRGFTPEVMSRGMTPVSGNIIHSPMSLSLMLSLDLSPPVSELQTNLSLAEPTRPERSRLEEDPASQQPTYSAVARKSKGPAPSPGVTKATPAPASSTSTPTQPAKSSGGFYSFLKRQVS